MNNVVQHPAGGHKVVLLPDSKLVMPEMYLEVYIEPDDTDPREMYRFINMFARAKCTKADDPRKADLVVFGGGADVNPVFYGANPHSSTRHDAKRDERDIKLYEICLDEGIPMVGICRGAQFLHVMNGGKLYQDIDGHVGYHPIFDEETKNIINRASSVHHQCCIENKAGGMKVLATSPRATRRWVDDKEHVDGNKKDVEAFFYRDTHCLGIQGHPEYAGYWQFMQWSLKQIYDYICCSTDCELPRDAEGNVAGRYRRLKPDFLAQRELAWKDDFNERLKEMN